MHVKDIMMMIISCCSELISLLRGNCLYHRYLYTQKINRPGKKMRFILISNPFAAIIALKADYYWGRVATTPFLFISYHEEIYTSIGYKFIRMEGK